MAGHVGLFMLLGTAVLLIFPRMQQRRTRSGFGPFLYFSLMAGMGMVQEFLQIVSFKHRPVAANDLFDLVVDLLAAGIVFIVFNAEARRRRGAT